MRLEKRNLIVGIIAAWFGICLFMRAFAFRRSSHPDDRAAAAVLEGSLRAFAAKHNLAPFAKPRSSTVSSRKLGDYGRNFASDSTGRLWRQRIRRRTAHICGWRR